jgi:hypothetical protein
VGDATVTNHVRDSVDLVAAGRVDEAPLPIRYERARTEIAAAASLDECAEWTSKAAALASYARQAKDDSLLAAATRIKARAIRRSGELLREIPARPGYQKNGAGAPPQRSDRAQAAKDAGLSRDQATQAVRVAKVPATEFEEAIEADEPPSIEELAERGTKKKPAPLVDLQGVDPEDFNRSLHISAAINSLADQLADVKPELYLRGVLPSDKKRVLGFVESVIGWCAVVSQRSRK